MAVERESEQSSITDEGDSAVFKTVLDHFRWTDQDIEHGSYSLDSRGWLASAYYLLREDGDADAIALEQQRDNPDTLNIYHMRTPKIVERYMLEDTSGDDYNRDQNNFLVYQMDVPYGELWDNDDTSAQDMLLAAKEYIAEHDVKPLLRVVPKSSPAPR